MHISIPAFVALTSAMLTACGGAGMTGVGGTPVLPAADNAAARQLISPDETQQTLSFPPYSFTVERH